MNAKIKNLPFFKSIFQLAAGSIIAQIITIISSPLLTRIYSVENMGIYALLLSIVSIFGSVINGKYDYAIVATKKEADIPKLIHSGILFSLFSLILISGGLTIYLYFNEMLWKQLGLWVYLTILMLFINGIVNILNALSNREKKYKIISEVYVRRTLVQNLLLLILGFFNFGPIGMMFSQLLGNLTAVKKQREGIKKKYTLFKNFNYKSTLLNMFEYKSFPLYTVPANFVNNLSYSILNFFISSSFGLTSLGLYSMTYKILGLPLSLVSVNVSKVFFREAAEEYKDTGTYHKALKKSSLFLLFIAIPMFIVLFFFSPFLFKLFFGEAWEQSGNYAQILAPLFSVRLIVGSLTPAFIICGKQKVELLFQCLFLISTVLSFLLTVFYPVSIEIFLSVYSISNMLIYLMLFVLIYKLGKEEKIND
ncbi:oligosaccharide flippase family protein [Enterococcus casseliflavus]|uniref:lipopolysaccharide biosynthesis protein n=1 Tax=Enterococcus casseliflavus TaxID=37734 RepID=UPI0022593996|nr:oligosaccharide flippase family protein [Enterococcus casseliflavus]MCX4167990.1 oligosaccharide flippase family protein [Enterococcus casseliflavus]